MNKLEPKWSVPAGSDSIVLSSGLTAAEKQVRNTAILVALLIVGGFFYLRQQRLDLAEAEAETPTAAVTRGSIEEVVSATGNVVADQQASLTFASSGEIAAGGMASSARPLDAV